ncbi:putative methyltransferase-domain-containing protein [Panaeolus papilionaceus]|nr:putative methyltransferase-domain-containing protein [Panaeolus papilionaceus]
MSRSSTSSLPGQNLKVGPVAPPTQLPPLGRLHFHPSELVARALQSLRFLYFPPISPSNADSSRLTIPQRKIHHILHDTSVPDSGYASAEEDEDERDIVAEVSEFDSDAESEADLIRADPLERTFAIKWVTGFIVRAEEWVEQEDSVEEIAVRSGILEDASALLSAFTGNDKDEQDSALTRTFAFPFGVNGSEGLNVADANTPLEIRVELNDAPLSNVDHTSVGLQSWAASINLGERFCLQPSFFSLGPSATPRQDKPLRILELGAGTGLLSIIADKILASYTPKVSTEIVATDYHPEVLSNLSKNVETNFPAETTSTSISVQALDWETPIYEGPLGRPFDLILAADVVYHPDHARWIKGCIERLLARPSDNPEAVFWLIIAVRRTGRHEGMDRTVDELFSDHSGDGAPVPCLRIFSCEEISRQDGIGRVDEDVYRLFKIGWA